ncbi:glycoside hydrolase 5 family protein [Natronoglomus mannanivorans]|uniref:mannan endo-1,4-beta-mannosidase n=1 Tax=Natronoglomus mannanivorans TaxID=2979990 RepID=A0AAP2Z3Z8_9EURY|nr:cellulase family glycosylhydrolase [Halobacteria archaeon AArc-xg1-1]
MIDRRQFLLSGVAVTSLTAGCTGAEDGDTEPTATETASSPTATESEPSFEPAFDSFVDTEGTEFVVDGDVVYFNGTNNFWVTNETVDRQRVDDCFQLFEDMGIDLVRTWAHCEAKGGRCLQPEPGVHNEEGLTHLDYLVSKAHDYDLRLVLALVDNWEHEGGIPQYIEWADGAENRGDFYTMDETRDLYRNHVETVLTRENTVTGLEYRDDPAIAMWELANEPRCERDDVDDGVDHAQVLHDWIADMSAYVKELDGNHLVSSGVEGFYTRGDDEWYYGDWTGQDYIENNRLETIDACSFHMYPDHWGEEFTREHGSEWIREHVEDAHAELGKPAYLGEFNVQVDRSDETTLEAQLEERNTYLSSWYETANEVDANAVLPWQVVLDETDDHDGFQLYRDESGEILETYAETAAAKSDR